MRRTGTRLVGRDDELSALVAAYRSTLSGSSQVLLVSGEPGIGKTALLDRFTEIALHDAGIVARGACYEDTASVPFTPIVESLRQLVAAHRGALSTNDASDAEAVLQELVADPSRNAQPARPERIDEAESRRGMYDRIGRLLLSASERRPLALVWDDLHWIDEGSAHLLRHLVRQLRNSRTTIVGSYRDTDVEPGHPLEAILRELNRERVARRVGLRRLDVTATRAIVERVLAARDGSVSRDAVETIHRESEGVPFFTEELTLHLREEGLLERGVTGDWRISDSGGIFVPQSVRGVVGHRLAHLSSGARDTLAAASVIGRDFRFDLLTEVMLARHQTPEDVVSAHLQEALARRLVVRRHGPAGVSEADFAFSHEQIRDVLYIGLSPIRRRLLHLDVGTCLERRAQTGKAAAVARLAHHFVEGQDIGKAGAYALDAARAFSRSHAVDEAIHHYQTVLEIIEIPVDVLDRATGRPATRLDALFELEPLVAEHGDRERHRRIIETILELADSSEEPLVRFQGHHRAANAAIRSGDFSRAYEHARHAVALSASTGPANELRARFDLAQTSIGRFVGEPSNLDAPPGDLRGAELELRRALEIARELGDRSAEGLALQELGVVGWAVAGDDRERRSQARVCLLEALECFRAADDRKGELTALIALAYRRAIVTNAGASNVEESYVSFLEEIRRLRSSEHLLVRGPERQRMETLTLLSIHVFCRVNGWYEMALARAIEAEDAARALRDRRIQVVARLGLSETEVLIGRPVHALEHAEAASVLLQADSLPRWVDGQRDALMRVQATAYRLAGDLGRAEDHARRRLDASEAGQPARVADAEIELVEVLLAARPDDPEAEALARRVLLRTAGMGGSITWDIRAELALSRIALAIGQPDVALGHVVAARTRLDGRSVPFLPLRIELALARGLVFQESQLIDEARAALGQALEQVQLIERRITEPAIRAAFAAHPLTVEVLEAARSVGIHPAPSAASPGRHPSGLTERELEVLRLVASGKTNREIAAQLFISEKTVARHLTNLFTKIGAESRTQAAAWAFRNELV